MTTGCGEKVQNTPLWLKNYFEQNAFEFLKSLICLKAGPPQRIHKTSVILNPLLGTARGEKSATIPKQTLPQSCRISGEPEGSCIAPESPLFSFK